MDSESESKLLSLISQLMHVYNTEDSDSDSEAVALIIQIISFISSMDLELQPKPESKFMSLTSQVISVFTSMAFQPTPLLELISLISQKICVDSESESEPKSDKDFMSLVEITVVLNLEPELLSLVHQILSLVISMDSKWKNLISLCPQVQVELVEGSFHVLDEVLLRSNSKLECLPKYWEEFSSKGKVTTHFFCGGCSGEDHEEYEKAPLEIKHHLHPKHYLQLVKSKWCGTKKCYCCDESLRVIGPWKSYPSFIPNIQTRREKTMSCW